MPDQTKRLRDALKTFATLAQDLFWGGLQKQRRPARTAMAGAGDYDDVAGWASGAIEAVFATPCTPQVVEVLVRVLCATWPTFCPFTVLMLLLISFNIKVGIPWLVLAPRNTGAGSSWQRLSPCTAGGNGDRLF